MTFESSANGQDHPPFERGASSSFDSAPESIDALIEELEGSGAHLGFDAENTRRLYQLLLACQRPDRARQSLRVLGLLAYLHYCENDAHELRELSREGVELAQELDDQRALHRFLGYWNLADRMERDFERGWGIVVALALLGTIGAASYAIHGFVLARQR